MAQYYGKLFRGTSCITGYLSYILLPFREQDQPRLDETPKGRYYFPAFCFKVVITDTLNSSTFPPWQPNETADKVAIEGVRCILLPLMTASTGT